jgi:hypothetical protein
MSAFLGNPQRRQVFVFRPYKTQAQLILRKDGDYGGI